MDKSDKLPFFKAGIVVFFGFVVVIVVQLMMFSSATSVKELEAKEKVRSGYPDYQWVFEEWEKCNNGLGVYKDYIMRRQCNSALIEIGKNRQQDPDEVERIINAQEVEIMAADKSVEPAWPLSVMADPIWRLSSFFGGF